MATGLFNLKQVNQAISQGAWSGYIAPKWVEYLVVAGGGGGGRVGAVAYSEAAGGGGAGGLLTGIVTVATGTSYTVTVGAGGTAGANQGDSGVAGGVSVFGAISAAGGGNSVGTASGAGVSGGSGAGANAGNLTRSQGVSGQGNGGGTGYSSGVGYAIGGGGGGAGTVGLSAGVAFAGNGGAGIASSISGSVVTYAGGGGGGGLNSGGSTSNTSGGAGGVGGGGNGYTYFTSTAATSGSSNTGGGGGGGGYQAAGAGGSGIVVVRYPGNVQFYTGGTVTYSNGYIVHNFTSSGTLAPTTPTVVSEYQISRSLRFNQPDSAYLNRTPASATNQKTWTWSAWVKRGAISSLQTLFGTWSANTDAAAFAIYFNSGDTLNVLPWTNTIFTSTAVFRDPSAWYHIVVAFDSTQATASNRVIVYVNGVNQAGTYPLAVTQGANYAINSAQSHRLGDFPASGFNTFGGYMTEVNFIDGQALPPTSFGYVNPSTGVWTPAKFVGGYGTNGFYLNFSDNSNTTAATLGKDYSGNGNNWTPNNFSVTAGAGNDSLVDSPTSYGTDTGVGGTVRGNYATLNPLVVLGTSAFTNGNLDVSVSSANTNNFATIAIPTSGKWYWEYQITSVGGGAFPMAGIIATGSSALTSNVVYRTNGDKNVDGTGSAYGATYTTTDIIGVAVDTDGGTVTFYKNGSSQGAITYATSSGNYSPALRSNAATDNFTFNFGQRAFANTAPSGFKALCTQNLPTPTIGATTATQANLYFNPVTWTGNSSQVNVGFDPDLLWYKARNTTDYGGVVDVLRGDTTYLQTWTTGAEATYAGLLTTNSTGFVPGSVFSTNSYVAWNWKANGSGSTNTAGSITSTVSANTTSGFSVVNALMNTGTNQSVGHGLGVKPAMVILKNRDLADNWFVWHQSLSSQTDSYLLLNSTAAVGGIPNIWGSGMTSTVIGVRPSSFVNASQNVIMYAFAEIAGYSKFGSYTGNGSADGPFVFTGMRPAYIMYKRTDTANNWIIYDTSRNPYNQAQLLLQADVSDAEQSSNYCDILSNGFKLRTSNAGTNASGGTYIYMAFASNPFKYSLAR